MESSENQKSILFPQSKLGKFAFGLGILTLVVLLLTFINSGLAKPMSENLLGFLVFLGIGAAIAALVLGLIAIIKQKERSITVFLMSVVGLAAFVWMAVNIIKDLVAK